MRGTSADVTAVMTAHHEGLLAGPSLRSFLDAVAVARAGGLVVETIAVLDNPNASTSAVFAGAEEWGLEVDAVSFADQGKTRNHAVGLVSGEHVAFLDGDDLWSENWLVEAHRACRDGGDRVIAHPEADWFFGDAASIFFTVDQRDPAFHPAHLRLGNLWDAMCMAPASAYREVPFADRDIAGGFAYEDWHWNMETLAAGYEHRIVPGTIHFKRRRGDSSYVQARANQSTTRHSPVLDYTWTAAWEASHD